MDEDEAALGGDHRPSADARTDDGGDPPDVHPGGLAPVVVDVEDVPGVHVDAAQVSVRPPDRAFAVVGDDVGELLGPHPVITAGAHPTSGTQPSWGGRTTPGTGGAGWCSPAAWRSSTPWRS